MPLLPSTLAPLARSILTDPMWLDFAASARGDGRIGSGDSVSAPRSSKSSRTASCLRAEYKILPLCLTPGFDVCSLVEQSARNVLESVFARVGKHRFTVRVPCIDVRASFK